ncbi:hypothetical protein C2E21_5300 [Chlorella sorokiniana]|uniref:Uncharacterized protein n=1 Tax=Chlorella sorokiniana TaxID=3076 RepID=A0A2P6TQK7_CHLSO|nr:hypothetical protein C2E21_5300 [Chlorella sorokiniana]|eukprot:PRW56318.1 hypothetical protein C2E21_5300 [Chlorella sorokiniana]
MRPIIRLPSRRNARRAPAPLPFKAVEPGMHASANTSKSAPAATDSEWTIPTAPAAAAAADATCLLTFFSSGRRSTVGEVQPPQVPYGVPPATSSSFWATDAYSLDLELSAAEALWLVSPPALEAATPDSLQLAPSRTHPMSPRALRTRAATAAAATKRQLRAAHKRVAASSAAVSWSQLRTAVAASPLLSARIR